MPAILRIFPYQTDASLSVLGQCGSYDQGAVGARHELACNIMPFRPVGLVFTNFAISRRRCLWHSVLPGMPL